MVFRLPIDVLQTAKILFKIDLPLIPLGIAFYIYNSTRAIKNVYPAFPVQL